MDALTSIFASSASFIFERRWFTQLGNFAKLKKNSYETIINSKILVFICDKIRIFDR